MQRKQARASRTGLSIGASSILVIFVLLCLVTFAVLSLVSARADKSLSDKNAAHLTAYYAAETSAYGTLSRIDTILQSCAADGASLPETEYLALCADRLAGGDWTVESSEQGLTVLYSEPVTETQSLTVQLAVRTPAQRTAESAGYYRLLCWAVEGEGDWQPSDELPVYGASSAVGALPVF